MLLSGPLLIPLLIPLPFPLFPLFPMPGAELGWIGFTKTTHLCGGVSSTRRAAKRWAALGSMRNVLNNRRLRHKKKSCGAPGAGRELWNGPRRRVLLEGGTPL